MLFRSLTQALALAGLVSAAEPVLVEEIIAKVNGDIITRSELDRTRDQMAAMLRAEGKQGSALESALNERAKDALRERIDQMLLVQKGKEIGISVESDVSKWLADLQLKSGIVDAEKFQAYVKEQAGQPFEDYKDDLRNGILTQRVLRQEVGRRITIPRSELEKYYNEHEDEFVREEQVFLRQILVSTKGKDEAGVAAAEKKAKELADRAKRGEKFHELAKQYSDEPVSREQYGDAGSYKRGQMRRELEVMVFDKEFGHVTDPIRTDDGFLILKVEDQHRAGLAKFEEVENEIMERLYMTRFQPQIREYLTQLRQEAFLEIKDGFMDTGAAPGKDTKWSDPAQLKPETVTKEEVAAQTRRRRLLWLIPIPGTSTTSKPSSSR
jgi:parvulin-like peptidyl-prolyl isomerase